MLFTGHSTFKLKQKTNESNPIIYLIGLKFKAKILVRKHLPSVAINPQSKKRARS